MTSKTKNNPGLLPLTFEPLPLGSVRPAGWLKNQLRIQAEGLSGHLDEFWPDIADSGWIGGQAEGWERAPYWLDGLVPLAWLLDDERLKAKVHRFMDYILSHQHEDGWLGPITNNAFIPPLDPWPLFIVLKVMTQYHDVTGDERVIPSMQRCLRRMREVLDGKTFEYWGGGPGLSSWAATRHGDLLLSIYWLYAKTGEDWLLDFAAEGREKAFDWQKYFREFSITWKVNVEESKQWTHVVNNAMAIKTPGVWYRQSRSAEDRADVYNFIDTLDRHHGQVTGVFSGDEHYATNSPSQGTETCAVVEYLFSLEQLISIMGDVKLADRLERIAFNALPAPFKPDMWARQYNQQANQVQCAVTEPPIWGTNGRDAGVYGLENNFGCCTANMHQGWPKFAAHLWMKTPDNGLAAIAYAPCVVQAKIGLVTIEVEVVTEYPFDDTIELRVRSDREARFPLDLRIPSWAEGATLQIADDAPASLLAGKFHRAERAWAQGETRLRLRLPMPVRVERRFNNSASISRGPLVYSLKVGDEWRTIGGEAPHADYEVYPTTPWNYALHIDCGDPAKDLAFERRPIGDCPFSPEGAPVVVKAKGRRLPAWGLDRGAAALPPQSPVSSSEPLEGLTLIPYGCAKLRVTEFPVLG